MEWLSLDNRFKNTPVTSFKIYAGAHLLKITDVGPNDIESYLTTKTNTFFELNETRRGTTSGTRLEKCTLKTECQHEASKFLSMSTTELIIYIPGKCYLPVKMGTRRTERRNKYEEQSSGKASGITCNAFAGLCIQGTFSNPQAQIIFHALEKENTAEIQIWVGLTREDAVEPCAPPPKKIKYNSEKAQDKPKVTKQDSYWIQTPKAKEPKEPEEHTQPPSEPPPPNPTLIPRDPQQETDFNACGIPPNQTADM